MVVISVVLAVAAPSLRGFFVSRQTSDTATALLSFTKYAKSAAIAKGCPCRLNIDASAGEFWLTIQQGGSYVPLEGDMGRHFQLPDGQSIRLQVDATNLPVASGGSAAHAGLSVSARGLTPPPPKRNSSGSANDQTYIQFYPSGRNDAGTIELTSPENQVYLVTAPSATDPFEIITPSEMP